MKNNFIQMTASVGHAVAYTIGPIFKHIIGVAVFHQCPLNRQLSLACRRNTYLWRHPTNNNQIAAPRWPNDISYAVIMRSPKTWRKTSSVASAAHFRRKMAQLRLWSKIRTKQWLVLGASAYQCMRAGVLCPNCDNFLFYIPTKIKMSFIWKDDFFCQNRQKFVDRKRIHNLFVRRKDKTNYLSNQT